ncbi:hypothetical protein IWQ62_003283 [Dispira parvispora]|uniref:Uncharacterized protein n=1 Tax=Dispira parvispora TaxID=1520584 RepID=A0A9W8AS43_9FUNG|nr:hypothetical protein IWQ62_003283 [Dispira parvispora]
MRLAGAFLSVALLQGSLIDARLTNVERGVVQGTKSCSFRQFYATYSVVTSEYEAYEAGQTLMHQLLATTGANYFNEDFEAVDQYFRLSKILAMCEDMVVNEATCGWGKRVLMVHTRKCNKAREIWAEVNQQGIQERVKNFLNYRLAYFTKDLPNPFPDTELANESNIDEKLIDTDVLGDFSISMGRHVGENSSSAGSQNGEEGQNVTSSSTLENSRPESTSEDSRSDRPT